MEIRHRDRLFAVSLIAFLYLFVLVVPVTVSAEPYAWPQFTVGDGEFKTSSNMEQMLGSFVHYSKENNDEVGITSFTWGSGNNDPINGFFGDNTAGLNSIDPSLAFPTGDGQFQSDFEEVADNDLTNRANFAPAREGGSPITHSKMITLSQRQCILTTLNFTAGGYSSQPNVALSFDDQTSVCQGAESEIKEMWNGTNFDNDVQWDIENPGPNGENIELYFYPDVKGNIPEDDLEGVLNREAEEASESALYMVNIFNLSSYADVLTSKPDDVLVEGLFDSGDDEVKDQLQNDHTARDWNDFNTGQMHHKTQIFDLETIVFGSANHTASAMANSPSEGNQEFMMVIDDFRLARKFVQNYRRMMQQVPSDDQGPADSFDLQGPDPVSNLQAQNVEGEGNALRVSWTPPSDPGDFSRYYIFAHTEELSSAEQIGDFEDADGDGLVDEDPTIYNGGNVTDYPTGFSVDTQKACDDDGDGECGEDPFMFPEAQVKTLDPAADTSGIVDSINYGEQMPNNTDIWVGVVGVDKRGNESEPRFFGPVQSKPAVEGADPQFELGFAEGASRKAGAESTLRIDLHNDTSAKESIIDWTLDLQELNDSFQPLSSQSPPDGWSVSVGDPQVTFNANSSADYIDAGETVTFFVNVKNPDQSGESAELLATTTDQNEVKIRDIQIGSLEIEPEIASPTGEVFYASDNEDTRAGRTSRIEAVVRNEDDASADISEITLNTGSDASSAFRYRSSQVPPDGWTITNIDNFEVTVSADDSSSEIAPGDTLPFFFNMRNPRSEGQSDSFTLTARDDVDNTISDNPLNSLPVQASESIIINEFMYSPEGTDDDFEFVELRNNNANSAIEIGGWSVTVSNQTFTVSEGTTIDPSGFLTFSNDVNDRDDDGKSFNTRYDVNATQGPAWTLDNTSDQIALQSADSTYSVTLNYDDSLSNWGTGADETGFSFEKQDPEIRDTGDPSIDGDNWAPSTEDGGTPTAPNSSQQIFESHVVTDGDNTATDLDGSETLRETSITVTIDLINEPAEDPVIFYDADQDPDGPGGSTSDESRTAQLIDDGDPTTWEVTIPASSSKIEHNVEFRYLWDLGDQIVDNTGQMYRVALDGEVSSPSNLAVENVRGNQVTLSFDGISDNDFNSYEIFFARQSPVGTDDNSQSFTEQEPGSVTVTDLQDQTEYFFNIIAEDNVGNTSPLNPQQEVSATTLEGFNVTVTEAEDGVNTITTFDGSKELRDADVTVSWETDEDVNDRDVELYYDILDDPDGEGGDNTGDRLRVASGEQTTFKATIPSSDEEWQPGRIVKFVVQIGDQTFFQGGEPYKFEIAEGVDQTVDNLTIKDQRSSEIDLSWNSISHDENFNTYRIYYSTDTPVSRTDNAWDKSDDQALSLETSTRTTVTGLSPNETYHFRIVAVNDAGSEGPLSESVMGFTNTQGSVLISEVNFSGDNGFDTYVELFVKSGPLDIQNFRISDVGGANSGGFANDTTTVSEGEYVIVHPTNGTTETDDRGDLDGNGVTDVFDTSLMATFTNDSSNEILLKDGNGDTLDALVYRPTGDDSIDNAQVSTLVPEQWNSSDSSAAVVSIAQTGAASIDNVPSIVRVKNSFGEFQDANSKADWQVTTRPTPGAQNQYIRLANITMTDVPTRSYHAGSTTISNFDGSKRLKNSGSVVLDYELTHPPVNEGNLQIIWDYNQNPLGINQRGETLGPLDFTGSEVGGSARFNPTNTDPDSWAHGNEARGLIELRHRAVGSNTKHDVLTFNNGGRFFKLTVDGAPEPDITNASLYRQSGADLTMSWESYDSNQIENFRGYRIYYDTDTVDSGSRFVSRRNVEKLGDVNTSGAKFTVPTVDRTWNVRVGSVDTVRNTTDFLGSLNSIPGVGDIGDFSDTVSVFVPEPISLETLTASEDTNSVDLLTKANGRLRNQEVAVRAVFDRNTDTAILHWNTTPDTPADPDTDSAGDSKTVMTKVQDKTYRATIPALGHDTTVTLGIQTDGTNFDRSGDGFRYTIDDQANVKIQNFRFVSHAPQPSDGTKERKTDIKVAWKALDRSHPKQTSDFAEYQVLYDSDVNVDNGGEEIDDAAKDDFLADSSSNGWIVKGLSANTEYAFGVRWKDKQGNVSVVSDTFDTFTINGEPAEDPVWDGTQWARKLDGTESLQGGQDYLVRFKLSSDVVDPNSVRLYYNALQDRNNALFSGHGDTGSIQMSHYDQTIWETTLKQDLPGISTAEKIGYYVTAGGFTFDRHDNYFRFNVNQTPVDSLTGVDFRDRGDEIWVLWDSVNLPDFQTYRVRYRTSTSNQWTVVDKSNNSNLGDPNTNVAKIPVNSSSNYEFNATAVDVAEHKSWQEQNLRIKRTENFAPVLSVSPDTIQKLYPNQTETISVYLEDLDGNPWSDQEVVWTKLGGPGAFANSTDTTLRTTTDADGRTSVDFETGDVEEKFTFFELSFPNSPGVEPVTINAYTMPDGADPSDIVITVGPVRR